MLAVCRVADAVTEEDFCVVCVAVLTASFVIFRLTTPARPPCKKPGELGAVLLPVRLAALSVKPPTAFPTVPAARETPLNATIASPSIEPPVCPTLTPILAMKLSIFCETLRKPTAQRNQTSTFPATASRLELLTAASTSLSSRANAGTAKVSASKRTVPSRGMIL